MRILLRSAQAHVCWPTRSQALARLCAPPRLLMRRHRSAAMRDHHSCCIACGLWLVCSALPMLRLGEERARCQAALGAVAPAACQLTPAGCLRDTTILSSWFMHVLATAVVLAHDGLVQTTACPQTKVRSIFAIHLRAGKASGLECVPPQRQACPAFSVTGTLQGCARCQVYGRHSRCRGAPTAAGVQVCRRLRRNAGLVPQLLSQALRSFAARRSRFSATCPQAGNTNP